MIFAKVDVVLPRHHRMQAIDRASALGVYVAALCHTREHELDGFVPAAAFRGFPNHSKADVTDLLKQGLLEEAEIDGIKGYMITKYAEKNETKADVAHRRSEAKERMRVVRANRNRTSDERARGVPGSGSGSRSGSGSVSGEVQEGARSAPEDPPAWFVPAEPPLEFSAETWRELEAWADSAGAPKPTADHYGLYRATRMKKQDFDRDPIEGFRGWMLREKSYAAKERERARNVGPTNRYGRPLEEPAPMPYHGVYKPPPQTERPMTAAEAAAAAVELEQRMSGIGGSR